MREKIYNVLNKIYGAILIVAFFAGVLPLIPFIVAIIVGGEVGEAISVFIYKSYYPWVVAASAIAVLIGWISLYFLKNEKKGIKDKAKANTQSMNDASNTECSDCNQSKTEEPSQS